MEALVRNEHATVQQQQRIQVEEIAGGQSDVWDGFVEAHPGSTMYHLYGWRGVLEGTFGYRSYYLAARDETGQVAGILPLVVMRDILGRRYLISNPFANFAGLCASSSEVGRALLERAFGIARHEKVQYLELRQLGERLDADLVQEPIPAKESFVTLMLDLSAGAESLWSNISSRNRGKVRKAEKSGLRMDLGLQYMGAFHSVLAHNLKHLGTPVHPLRFFETLAEVFPERVNLLVLKQASEVVSVMFLFKFKNILAEPWVASLREYNRVYVNNLLYWKAIEYACQNGYTTFDFGRSTVDSGTFNFKLQWGARPVQLYYHYYLHRADAVPVVDANENQYARYIDLWRKLPLKLTKIMGPRLVKYVPQL